MPNGITTFQPEWLTMPEYVEWLARASKAKRHAFCKLRKKRFDIGNVRKGALNCHADGGTHNNLLKAHLKSKSKPENYVSVKK